MSAGRSFRHCRRRVGGWDPTPLIIARLPLCPPRTPSLSSGIKQRLPLEALGLDVTTFAYPFGKADDAYNDEIVALAASYYERQRSTEYGLYVPVRVS